MIVLKFLQLFGASGLQVVAAAWTKYKTEVFVAGLAIALAVGVLLAPAYDRPVLGAGAGVIFVAGVLVGAKYAGVINGLASLLKPAASPDVPAKTS